MSIVYQTLKKEEANRKVYLVQDPSKADLNIRVTSNRSEVSDDPPVWLITKIREEARLWIYFTNDPSEADLKVFFTK